MHKISCGSWLMPKKQAKSSLVLGLFRLRKESPILVSLLHDDARFMQVINERFPEKRKVWFMSKEWIASQYTFWPAYSSQTEMSNRFESGMNGKAQKDSCHHCSENLRKNEGEKNGNQFYALRWFYFCPSSLKIWRPYLLYFLWLYKPSLTL